MRKLLLSTLLLLVSPYAFGDGAAATTAAQAKATTEEIFSEYMSPYCPGRLLRDCPSSSASELRESVYSKLLSGSSKEDIAKELVATFGDDVRAAPLPVRFGLVGWIAPFAFLILGATLLIAWLRRGVAREKPPAESPRSEEPLSAEMQARIAEELRLHK